MPEESTGQKTEQPTPRRLQKAREEGQIARSQELNSAFTLLGAFLALAIFLNRILVSLGDKMYSFITLDQPLNFTAEDVLALMVDNFYFIINLVLPVMLVTASVGLLISFIQVGPRFIPKLLLPKLSKLNPIEGLKRIFSLKSVIELIKSVAKALVIGIIAYLQFKGAWPQLISLSEQGFEPGLLFIVNLLLRIIISIIIFLIVLGIGDYIYQRWEHKRNLMMTKQEVKEEYKEYEGDPQIKSRRRQKQRELSMNRMIKAVEEADVVITNPTQIAVALKFDIEIMETPLVVAKGEGFIAQKIRETAEKHGIEIVENRPLARALNAAVEIGDEIPSELYQAVAEVLAYIYRKQNRHNF